MISLKSSPRSSLIAAFSLIAFAAVACSSSANELTAFPATVPASKTVNATASPTQQPSEDTSPSTGIAGTPQSPRFSSLAAASNRIAFISSDGSIYTIDPDGSDRHTVIARGGGIPGEGFLAVYAWPFWSPDGKHLLTSAFTPDISGGLETSLLRIPATVPGSNPQLLYLDVPGSTGIGGSIPHFPLWHPDSESLALIANVGDGLATFLVDIDDGIGSGVSNGAPVYLDWSSDGSHMLVHTAERLVLHEFQPDGTRKNSQSIGTGSISYRVPQFAPGSNKYAYIDITDGVRNLLIGSPDEPFPEQARLASTNNAFAWSPDGSRLAFADSSRISFYETLRIIDPEGDPDDDIVIDTPVQAFWWSPDGQNLLVVLPGGEPGDVALAVVDSATGDVNLLGLAQPSAEMAFVISFFDQYAADMNLWSPDSTRFIFSGALKDGLIDEDAGINVQFGDPDSKVWVITPSKSDPPISLGAGAFGTWSPE